MIKEILIKWFTKKKSKKTVSFGKMPSPDKLFKNLGKYISRKTTHIYINDEEVPLNRKVNIKISEDMKELDEAMDHLNKTMSKMGTEFKDIFKRL